MKSRHLLHRAGRPLRRAGLLAAVALSAGLLAGCRSEPATPAAPARESVPVAELLRQADQLYAQRESLERAREAVATLRRAMQADYGNFEAAWKLSKFNYYLGEHAGDEKQREAAFQEGISAGEAAIRLAPDRPEGHFWLGANLGGRAKLKGPLTALSSLKDIRREMETVIRLDEGYQAGSAYLALAQIELEMPELLGGDRRRAVELLEKGLRFGEQNVMLRLRLGQAYLQVKRTEDAHAQFRAILAMKPHPEYVAEYRRAEAEARRLLASGR